MRKHATMNNLYTSADGLCGLVGFREADNRDMTWPATVAKEQAS